MRFFLIVSFTISLLANCWSAPVAKKVAPSPSPTAYTIEGVNVDKPVNARFSTYSKEWPVGWQWVDPEEDTNPARYDVKTGVLRVRLPTGKNLSADNRKAPRYVKAIKGNFEIETRVKILPKENYQGAGILIYKDENNYMRFERAYGGVGGGGEGIRIDIRRGDEYTPLVTPNDIPTDAGEVDLKVVRNGSFFTAFWRLDEESEWREAGEFESDYPETILAGVSASNTAREIIAEFAYIKLAPATVR